MDDLNDKYGQNIKTKEQLLSFLNYIHTREIHLNGIDYFFHGLGCRAQGDKTFLEWDFGYRSRFCGIHPWKLALTLRNNNHPLSDYYNYNVIQELCDVLVESGCMFKMYGQYYFSIQKKDAFIPKFPKEYDLLVVKWADKKWTLLRSKKTDRFIRKSTMIDNAIFKNEQAFLLCFYCDGKEVFSIPYDDISYPPNAIKIMSDDIFRNNGICYI